MARYINVDELRMKIHDKYTISYFKPTKEDMQLIGIFEIINAQPTADVVEVRHGEWRPPLGDDGCGWNCGGEIKQILGCSCCGHFYQNAPYNYCPNCGAKMRGDNE